MHAIFPRALSPVAFGHRSRRTPHLPCANHACPSCCKMKAATASRQCQSLPLICLTIICTPFCPFYSTHAQTISRSSTYSRASALSPPSSRLTARETRRLGPSVALLETSDHLHIALATGTRYSLCINTRLHLTRGERPVTCRLR